MELHEDIEMQLWEYLDGTLSNIDDSQRIAHLIEQDSVWQQKYQELSALHSSLSAHIDNDMPSMSFGRNVMEVIARNKIASATKKYINPAIINGIAATFILGLTLCLVYACTKVNWVLPDSSSTDIISNSFDDLSFSFNNGMLINIFISINIILALLLGDKMLRKKRYVSNNL